MTRYQRLSVSSIIILLLVIFNTALIKEWYVNNSSIKWWLVVTVPLLILAIRDRFQKKHAITLAEIRPSGFLRRINEQEVKSFEEIYAREKLRSFTKVIPLN